MYYQYLWLQNYIGLSSKMSDIEKVFGTKRGNSILNTTILMVKKLLTRIDKQEELHTVMKFLSHLYEDEI